MLGKMSFSIERQISFAWAALTWLEAALAHSDKNEVRRAYNRSTYIEHRKELMIWWGKKIAAK